MGKFKKILKIAGIIIVTLAVVFFGRYFNERAVERADTVMRTWTFGDFQLGTTEDALNKVFKEITGHVSYVQPPGDQWSDAPHNTVRDDRHIVEIKSLFGRDTVWIDGKKFPRDFEHIFRKRCCAQFSPFPTLTSDGRFIFTNYTKETSDLVEITIQ